MRSAERWLEWLLTLVSKWWYFRASSSSKMVLFIVQFVCVWQISPRHCPTLASPCGHTLCEQCCYRQCYCPVCHCFIDSRLTNVALQRVIVEHHQQTHPHHRQQQQQQLTDSESLHIHNNNHGDDATKFQSAFVYQILSKSDDFS